MDCRGSPELRGRGEGSHTHRESLPQEPHVGDAVVDLRQHVLQILGRDPGSAGERGDTCSGGLGWRSLTPGLEHHMHGEAVPKGTSAVTQGRLCDPRTMPRMRPKAEQRGGYGEQRDMSACQWGLQILLLQAPDRAGRAQHPQPTRADATADRQHPLL